MINTLGSSLNIVEASKKYYREAFLRRSSEFTHVQVKNDEFAYTKVNGHMIIVFDGSDDEREWFSKTNYKKNKHGYHTGFFNSFNEILKILMNEVSHKIDSKAHNLIIGYSKGGAFASEAMNYVPGFFRFSCVTFGSPRYADKIALKRLRRYEHNIFHIVNSGDWFPGKGRFIYANTPGYRKVIKKGSKLNIFGLIENHRYFND